MLNCPNYPDKGSFHDHFPRTHKVRHKAEIFNMITRTESCMVPETAAHNSLKEIVDLVFYLY